MPPAAQRLGTRPIPSTKLARSSSTTSIRKNAQQLCCLRRTACLAGARTSCCWRCSSQSPEPNQDAHKLYLRCEIVGCLERPQFLRIPGSEISLPTFRLLANRAGISLFPVHQTIRFPNLIRCRSRVHSCAHRARGNDEPQNQLSFPSAFLAEHGSFQMIGGIRHWPSQIGSAFRSS